MPGGMRYDSLFLRLNESLRTLDKPRWACAPKARPNAAVFHPLRTGAIVLEPCLCEEFDPAAMETGASGKSSPSFLHTAALAVVHLTLDLDILHPVLAGNICVMSVGAQFGLLHLGARNHDGRGRRGESSSYPQESAWRQTISQPTHEHLIGYAE